MPTYYNTAYFSPAGAALLGGVIFHLPLFHVWYIGHADESIQYSGDYRLCLMHT